VKKRALGRVTEAFRPTLPEGEQVIRCSPDVCAGLRHERKRFRECVGPASGRWAAKLTINLEYK